MKRLFAVFLACFLGFGLVGIDDAEAKRFGGGRSSGMQRQATPQRDYNQQATPQRRPDQAATAPAKRNWMRPLAGIAAALGIAALLSHFGLGEAAANILTIALLVLGAVLLFRWLLNRNKRPAQSMNYAGAHAGQGMPYERQAQPAPAPVNDNWNTGNAGLNTPASLASGPFLPPGFDADAFLRQAKVNFIRLQAANDAGDMDDIRTFTTPEMFAEAKMQLNDRAFTNQKTDVLNVDAQVLDYSTDSQREIVSVRFKGMIREVEGMPAEAFDEIWHFVRPLNSQNNWLVAGIQQNG